VIGALALFPEVPAFEFVFAAAELLVFVLAGALFAVFDVVVTLAPQAVNATAQAARTIEAETIVIIMISLFSRKGVGQKA